MIRNSVVAKLWLAVASVVIILLVGLGVTLDRIATDAFYTHVTNALVDEGVHYARFLSAGITDRGLEAVAFLGEISGTPVAVIAGDHTVLTAYDLDHVQAGRRLELEQVDLALGGKTTVRIGPVPFAAEDMFAAAVPIFQENEKGSIEGAVLVLSRAASIRHAVGLMRRSLLGAGLLGVILAAGLALFLSRRLAKPLVTMERVAQRMADGDYSGRVDPRGNDEIARLGHAFNHLAERLDYHRRTRREFLANVSHELRTPLSYVEGYARALVDGLAGDAQEEAGYHEIIYDESRRLHRLVDDLFDLTRLEEGRLTLAKGRLPLNNILDAAAERFQREAQQKGLVLENQAEISAAVVGDKDRLLQVFVNLLDNAVRHTPAGGCVVVRLQAETRTGVPGFRVTVSDSGEGIPPEELSLVFERFHKVDRARTRQGGGTGLGLAIVKNLVESHDGVVWAESDPQMGTCMHVWLPAA